MTLWYVVTEYAEPDAVGTTVVGPFPVESAAVSHMDMWPDEGGIVEQYATPFLPVGPVYVNLPSEVGSE